MTDTKNEKSYVAIVRVRGMTKIRSDIQDTMRMLGVDKKNSMVIREVTPSILGMVKKVKDYVTYGILDEKSKESLKNYPVGETVNLHPPRGGYERKGTKVNFSIGGALGHRGIKIIDLIERMQKL